MGSCKKADKCREFLEPQGNYNKKDTILYSKILTGRHFVYHPASSYLHTKIIQNNENSESADTLDETLSHHLTRTAHDILN
jgi:hypothetical protein